MTAAVSNQRLNSLTGVRFFAAFLVLGFHAVHYGSGNEFAVFASGMSGVSLFYLLSGFVMSWTAREGGSVRNFYARRFARIYPAYIVVWAGSLIALGLVGSVTILDVLAPPSLLQAWVPLESVYFAGSAVFWSLSCEVFFYLIFPFLYRGLKRCGDAKLVLIVVAAAATSIAVSFVIFIVGESDLARWLLVIFPPIRFLEFLVGAALGLLFRRGRRVNVSVTLAVLLSTSAVVVASWAPFAFSRYAVTIVPFALLICSLASSDLSGRRGMLSSRPLVALGNWSYCFYLVHIFVVAAVFAVVGSANRVLAVDDLIASWVAFFLALSLTVACSWGLHTVVERPMERLLREKLTVARAVA